jgi:hypothetical protein
VLAAAHSQAVALYDLCVRAAVTSKVASSRYLCRPAANGLRSRHARA